MPRCHIMSNKVFMLKQYICQLVVVNQTTFMDDTVDLND